MLALYFAYFILYFLRQNDCSMVIVMSKMETVLGIDDLPDEVLEYMLSLLSPYRDFSSVMLVCHRWYNIMKGILINQ